MTVKLRKRKLASGNLSLYLDIYQSGKRAYEFLGLYLTQDKTASKETLKLAQNIQAKRQVEIHMLVCRSGRCQGKGSGCRWPVSAFSI